MKQLPSPTGSFLRKDPVLGVPVMWGSGWNTQLGGVIEVMEAETFLIRNTHTQFQNAGFRKAPSFPLAVFFTFLPVKKGL